MATAAEEVRGPHAAVQLAVPQALTQWHPLITLPLLLEPPPPPKVAFSLLGGGQKAAVFVAISGT